MSDNDERLAEWERELLVGQTITSLDTGDEVIVWYLDGRAVRGKAKRRRGSPSNIVEIAGWVTVNAAAPSGITDITVISRATPPLPEEPPVGSGVFHDGVLYLRRELGDTYCWCSADPGWWSWADIQPCVLAVPAVPVEAAVAAAPRDWLAEMEAAPVGTLAVFYGGSGTPVWYRKYVDGWGDGWSALNGVDAAARYGDPVALHYPKEAALSDTLRGDT